MQHTALFRKSGVNANNTRGRLTATANSNSTTNYTSYDALGNILTSNQQTDGQTYYFSYGYNLAGQLISETLPDGRTLTTTYDRAGRATALSGTFSGTTTPYISSEAYGLFGLPYYYMRGNNVQHQQSYNIRMQPTESYEAINNYAGSILFVSCPNWGVNVNWGVFDICPHANTSSDNGTVQSYTEYQGGSGYPSFTVFNQTLTYDGLNRLTSASDDGGWARTFNYDQWGNSWVSNVTGPLPGNTPTYNVYNSKNQISSYIYDAAGNLGVLNGNTATYTAENLLSSLTATGGASETLSYDPANQRVEKQVSGSPLTVYVFDAFGRLAAEYANGNSWQRDYIFDGTGFVFASENPSGSACTTCYFGYDHLGSVRIVMDGGGNVVARHDYLPFGEEISGSAGRTTPGFTVTGDATTQRFTGQIRDQESGEDYFNARYFTATLGRFNSPDPMNAGASLGSSQSWNGYAYVLGNPLALVDPSGMDTCADGSWASVCVTANLPGWFSTWNFSWFYNAWRPTSQSNGGGSGSKSPANTTPPAKTGTLSCSGNARVLKGNSKQIGLPGGWDGDFIKPHILVTKNGAAIIPSQWGVTDKGPFRQFLSDISGKFPNASAAFQGVSDIVGGKRDPMFPKLPVQQGLMAHYPGVLIIELPGGNDLGTTAVTLSVPSAIGCPQGTSVVP